MCADMFMGRPLSGAAASRVLSYDVMMTPDGYLLALQQQQRQQISAERPRRQLALPAVDGRLYSQLSWSASSSPAWHIPESSVVFRPWVINY